MSRYLVSPDAEADLLDIWHYLFEETGLVITDRIRNELLDAFTSLSDFPSSRCRNGWIEYTEILFTPEARISR